MMVLPHKEFNDIKIIDVFSNQDVRGEFTKLFSHDMYMQAGIDMEIKEAYYSVSQKDVIRGMHFQLPPYEHAKIVHVLSGSVLDVIVDLRKRSDTYKKCIAIQLDANKRQAIYIPKGFAHGFKALEEGTVMQYYVSSVYVGEADSGIRYDSIGFKWDCEKPIVSARDKQFVALEEFESPF